MRASTARIREKGFISARSIVATITARAIAVSVLHLITLPQLQLRAQQLPKMRGRVCVQLRVSRNCTKETSSQNYVSRFVYETELYVLRRHVVFINGTWQNCGTRVFLSLLRARGRTTRIDIPRAVYVESRKLRAKGRPFKAPRVPTKQITERQAGAQRAF